MNRKIKFRAWNGKQMMYRGLHDRNWYTDEKGGKVIQGVHPDDIRMPIMEFSGEVDENGNGIYEGDWVHVAPGYCSRIEFKNGSFISIYTHPEDGEELLIEDITPNKCKVIGNIHDIAKRQ